MTQTTHRDVIARQSSHLSTVAPDDPILAQNIQGEDKFATTQQSGGTLSTPLPLLLLSRRFPLSFGRYKMINVLGEGEMGAVYLAHDTHLGRQVAVKIPKLDRNPNSFKRFEREALAMANLRHPNICPVYDVGEIDGTHYFTMAYIDGETLADHLVGQSNLPNRKFVSWVYKMALALDTAHQSGVIHRDLKPTNVMIDSGGEPIIMDFGLAKLAEHNARLTDDGLLLGTPAYMSPEQVRGEHKRTGPTTDVYSLGVMMYEMLTGRLPFDGTIASMFEQILAGKPEPPSHYNAGLDRRLEAICLTAMAKSETERFSSARLLAETLRDYLAGNDQRPAALAPPHAKQHTELDTKKTETVQSQQTGATKRDRWRNEVAEQQLVSTCKQATPSVPLPTHEDDAMPRWLVWVLAIPGVVFLFLITLVMSSGRNDTDASSSRVVKNELVPSDETLAASSNDSPSNEWILVRSVPGGDEANSQPLDEKAVRAEALVGDENLVVGEVIDATREKAAGADTRASSGDHDGTRTDPGSTKTTDTSAVPARIKPREIEFVVAKPEKEPRKEPAARPKEEAAKPKKPDELAVPVVVFALPAPPRHDHGPSSFSDEVFRDLDRNNDGVLTANEVPIQYHHQMLMLDKNNDSRITRRELDEFHRSRHRPSHHRHHRR